MDSIGDWLYIVFLVIAGISSMFNAAKKKKEEQNAPQEAPIPQPRREQRQARRAKRSARSIPAQQPIPVYTTEQVHTATPTTHPFLTAEQEIPAHLTAEATTPVIEASETNGLPSFADQDELRKAILYAEILQRKV